jgi:hypothetical protein
MKSAYKSCSVKSSALKIKPKRFVALRNVISVITKLMEFVLIITVLKYFRLDL